MSGFDAIQNEIDWARSCINRGNEAFDAYLKDKSFAFVVEIDPSSGEQIHKLKMMKPLPPEVSHYFRNALLDLKHSFDRSLHIAARTMGRTGFDRNYPWSDSIDGLEKILKTRQGKPRTSLPDGLLKEIRAQEPYSGPPATFGPKHLVREIANMANDKHSIGFQVSASVSSISVNINATGMGIVNHGWDSVNNEMIVAKGAFDGKASYCNTDITVEVLFQRSGRIGQIPVAAALTEFANRAQACHEGFKRVAFQGIK